jgi:hypothetical protein
MTRNMTTTELTEHKVKELNQLITDLQQTIKRVVDGLGGYFQSLTVRRVLYILLNSKESLEQKVENLKNERLNLAITELDKDAIIRKAIKFCRDLWDVVEDKQIKDLDNCNEMLRWLCVIYRWKSKTPVSNIIMSCWSKCLVFFLQYSLAVSKVSNSCQMLSSI